MIHLSTNKIQLKSSSKELFNFMSQPDGIAQIIKSKKTKHLEVKGEIITFILKWVARFNFQIDETTEEYIQIKSSKDVEFESVIRFDISEEYGKSAVIIHTEMDTAPFVDFTVEGKIKKWVSVMADNLEQQFG